MEREVALTKLPTAFLPDDRRIGITFTSGGSAAVNCRMNLPLVFRLLLLGYGKRGNDFGGPIAPRFDPICPIVRFRRAVELVGLAHGGVASVPLPPTDAGFWGVTEHNPELWIMFHCSPRAKLQLAPIN